MAMAPRLSVRYFHTPRTRQTLTNEYKRTQTHANIKFSVRINTCKNTERDVGFLALVAFAVVRMLVPVEYRVASGLVERKGRSLKEGGLVRHRNPKYTSTFIEVLFSAPNFNLNLHERMCGPTSSLFLRGGGS